MTIRWLAAGSIGLGISLLVALSAWVFSPVAPGLSAMVFAICTLPAGVAFGWLTCVAPKTVPKQGPSDDDVESRWLNTALSGTATDLVIVIGLGLTVVSVTRSDPPATVLLLALLMTAFVSCTLRYTVQKRRMLAA